MGDHPTLPQHADTEAITRADRIAEARRLRTEDGLSKRQIADRLGVPGRTLTGWLRGTVAPTWTERPNAKDELRERARAMRRHARSVPEIATELGVSKSTVSLWVRDIALDVAARCVLYAREHSSHAAHARMMAGNASCGPR